MQALEINKPNINDLIVQSLLKLNYSQQIRLIEFINSLTNNYINKPKNLLKFAGSIEKGDLAIIQRTIENDCERINYNEW